MQEEEIVAWVDRPFPEWMGGILPPNGEYYYETEYRDHLLGWPDNVRRAINTAIVYEHPVIDGKFLDTFPNCTHVANFGRGVPHIACEELRRRGVTVTNAPHGMEVACTELALALTLMSLRSIMQSCQHAMSDAFTHYDADIFMGATLEGKTIGIFGMGAIGTCLARKLHKGHGCRILYNSRSRKPEIETELGAEWRELDELCVESDILYPLADQNAETIGAINARRLSFMSRSARVINIGRGALVDGDALARAISMGTIAGAALDVTDPEPLPRDHLLVKHAREGRIIMTSHIASAVRSVRRRMLMEVVENIKAFKAGNPQNVVN